MFMPFIFLSWPQGMIKIVIVHETWWLKMKRDPFIHHTHANHDPSDLSHFVSQTCFTSDLFVFLGKRPSKNLQGTVASGNEQRRILPRPCGARTIFGFGFQLMVNCWFGIWSWYPQIIVPFTRGSWDSKPTRPKPTINQLVEVWIDEGL